MRSLRWSESPYRNLPRVPMFIRFEVNNYLQVRLMNHTQEGKFSCSSSLTFMPCGFQLLDSLTQRPFHRWVRHDDLVGPDDTNGDFLGWLLLDPGLGNDRGILVPGFIVNPGLADQFQVTQAPADRTDGRWDRNLSANRDDAPQITAPP